MILPFPLLGQHNARTLSPQQYFYFLMVKQHKAFSPIFFFPSFKIAKEKGLLYSTLQQEAEICPSFGFGKAALPSLTKCDPSGIIDFLSKGTTPTIFSLVGFINAFSI